MNNPFAKIIELEGSQVLITKHTENEEPQTHLRTDCYGLEVTYKLPFKTEKGRDEHFDSYSEVNAIGFRNEVVDMLKEQGLDKDI